MVKIYIENFPFKVTDESLKAKFEEFGIVDNAHIITDKNSGRSRCFGFVEMTNDEEATAAITALHNSVWEARTLIVNISKSKKRKAK